MPKKMKLTRTARIILRSHFLRKNAAGKTVETPEALFKRCANTAALAESKYCMADHVKKLLKKRKTTFAELSMDKEFQKTALKNEKVKETAVEFYKAMTSMDFLPNSPALMNAGKKSQQLMASFALPVGDSLESIFKSIQQAALIHQAGGGTGFNFSQLRPKGDSLKSIGGYTSGPVPFMRIFDAATEQIKKGGIRRGANMGILKVTHPDIMEFINLKSEERILENFNISIAIPNNFMHAVRDGKSINLINPRSKKREKKISARRLFSEIAKAAWACGDPGVIFIDRMNKDNPTPHEGRLTSTDSCADQPLLDYEAAPLGAVNLSRMLRKGTIDWDKLEKTTRLGVRFLDNLIDVTTCPLEETEHIVKKNRKIGLGVMGLADLLAGLKVAYDSEKGVTIAESLISFMSHCADKESLALAKERGVFPNWGKSIYSRKSKAFGGSHLRLRNATRMTLSPTGTTSMLAGCSSGIEPLFALFSIQQLVDRQIVTLYTGLRKALRKEKILCDEIISQIQQYGSVGPLESLPKHIRVSFPIARQIKPYWHIRMQAAFQKYIQNAVSKTINLPKSTTVTEVKKALMLAFEMGCKGVSVYREGSLSGEVLKQGFERNQRLLFDYY